MIYLVVIFSISGIFSDLQQCDARGTGQVKDIPYTMLAESINLRHRVYSKSSVNNSSSLDRTALISIGRASPDL